MKKLFTLFFLLTCSFINYGQSTYFDQDFLANTTVASYVNVSASNKQFTEIPTVTGITNTITNGRYQIAKSGTTAVNYRFGRGIDFASEPKSMYCQFNFGVATAAAATKNNAIVLSLGGSGIVDGATVPTAANTYAKLNFNLISGGLTFQLNDGITNSVNFTGNQNITFVMNNTGATFTYVAPDGTNETLGNDLFDVWVGTTKVFNERPVTTATQAVKRFRFDITHDAAVANAPTVSFDNFLMRDVTGSLLVSTNAVATPDSMLVKYTGTGAVKNVGLGTNTPGAKLEVNATTANTSGVRLTQLKSTSPAAAANGKVLSVNANGDIVLVKDSLGTGGGTSPWTTTGANINSSNTGNVGIGTATPITKLTIQDANPTLRLEATASPTGYYTEMTSMYDGAQPFVLKVGTDKLLGVKRLTTGNPNTQSYINGRYGIGFSTQAGDPDSTSLKMFIASGGNVGIGTYSKLYQTLNINGGIGFANQNNADKKLYSPTDGDLEWLTNNLAAGHGFAISDNGTKAVYLNTSGNSYLNGGNVGIGTATPTNKLEINGTGSGLRFTNLKSTSLTSSYTGKVLSVDANGDVVLVRDSVGTVGSGVTTWNNSGTNIVFANTGNVGIGTVTPTEKLVVEGNGKFSNSVITKVLTLSNFSPTIGSSIQLWNPANTNYSEIRNESVGSISGLSFRYGGGESMRIDGTDGNVGIGTATPTAKLEVAGTFNLGGVLKSNDYGIEIAGSNNAPGVWFYGDRSYGLFLDKASNKTVYRVNNNDNAFVISSGSNVGIGTATPRVKLQVEGSTRIVGNLNVGDSLSSWIPFNVNQKTPYVHSAKFAHSGTAQNRQLLIGYLNGGMGLWSTTFDGGNAANLLLNSAGGNVGIGTETPESILHVGSNTKYGIANGLSIGGGTNVINDFVSNFYTENLRNGVLHINTRKSGVGFGDIVLSEYDGGKVGIGTTTPQVKLEVAGPTDASGLRFTNLKSSTTLLSSYTGKVLSVDVNGDVVLVRDSVGTVGAGANAWTVNGANISRQSGNVGIGTASPNDTTLLHIKGGHTTSSTLLEYPLDAASQLQGSIFLKTWASEPNITWNGTGIGANINNYGLVRMNKSLSSAYIRFIPQKTSGMMLFSTVDAAGVKYDNTMAIVNDKIGIGTTTPTTKLEVNSTINEVSTFKGTAGIAAFRFHNDINKGISLFTYKSDYASGSMFGVGANGSGVIQTANAPMAIGTWEVAQPILFGTGTTEKMRISAEGNVGIGTTTPTEKLSVLHNGSTTPFGAFGVDVTSFSTNVNAVNSYFFRVRDIGAGNVVPFIINGAGNVGIGTSTPNAKLDIASTIGTSGLRLSGLSQTNVQPGPTRTLGVNDAGEVVVATSNSSANAWTITGDNVSRSVGNVGIGTTTPTAKLEVNGEVKFNEYRTFLTHQDAQIRFGTPGTSGNGVWGLGISGDSTDDFLLGNNKNGTFPLWIKDSTGNVGLGNNAPETKLHVTGDVTMGRVDGSKWYFQTPSSDLRIVGAAPAHLSLLPQGNVGIGTTTPTNTLTVDSKTTNSGLTLIGLKSTVVNVQEAKRPLAVNASGEVVLGDAVANPSANAWTVTGNNISNTVLAGNVGIGTASPANKFHVVGDTRLDGNLYVAGPGDGTSFLSFFVGRNKTDPNFAGFDYDNNSGWTSWKGYHNSIRINDNGYFDVSKGASSIAAPTNLLRVVASTGNVGIGTETTNPTAKLEVNSNDIDVSIFKGTSDAAAFRFYNDINKGITLSTYKSTYPTTQGSPYNVGANGSIIVQTANAPLAIGTWEVAQPILFGTGTTEKMRISADGNVGIGTTTPSSKLNVVGDINIDDAPRNSRGFLSMNNGEFAIKSNNGAGTGQSFISFYTNPNLSTGPTERMRISSDGNVGIGVSTLPTGYKLAIAGDMIAERVVVKLQSSGWPDYVFTPSYHLSTLPEVEKFIEQNHHLPNVPSAKEVADKGIDVGAMNTKFMEKIEELTLYLIEQNKKLEALEKKNVELENVIKGIKK